MAKLAAKEIKSALEEVPEWVKKGTALTRTFEFEDFAGAIRFVNALAAIAEKMEHHPDIDIRWNKVTLSLSTHDAGGLTQKDFELAKRLDRMAVG